MIKIIAFLGGLGLFVIAYIIAILFITAFKTPPKLNKFPAPTIMNQEPFEFNVATKNKAIENCEKAGNVPVMGFGFTVVCIEKGAVVIYEKTTQ